MWRKVRKIVLDFLKSAKTSELLEIFVTPAVLTLVLIICFSFCSTEVITQFTSSFSDSLLTIAALLATFSIASVTIILTSSSKTIDRAKETFFGRKNSNNIPISHYQLVVIRNYYNIFIQLLLLIISIISKFILFDGSTKVILILEVYVLLHSIITQIFVVTTLYHLMWDDNPPDDIKFKDDI